MDQSLLSLLTKFSKTTNKNFIINIKSLGPSLNFSQNYLNSPFQWLKRDCSVSKTPHRTNIALASSAQWCPHFWESLCFFLCSIYMLQWKLSWCIRSPYSSSEDQMLRDGPLTQVRQISSLTTVLQWSHRGSIQKTEQVRSNLEFLMTMLTTMWTTKEDIARLGNSKEIRDVR